jgi:prepilin-type N-terminal cleavage/methylation domain-containing protein
MHLSRHRGFTLIELLVVIAIIALLVTILMPTLTRAKDLARRAVCASNMRNIATANQLYATEGDGEMAPCHLYSDVNFINFGHWVEWFYWPSKGWQNLAFLYVAQTLAPGSLYCPAQDSAQATAYEENARRGFPPAESEWRLDGSTLWAYSPDDPTYSLRGGFAWNPRKTDDASGLGGPRKYETVEDLNPSDVLACDVVRMETPHAGDDGWNVLLGDGSVGFAVDETVLEIIAESNATHSWGFDRDVPAWREVLDRLAAGR